LTTREDEIPPWSQLRGGQLLLPDCFRRAGRELHKGPLEHSTALATDIAVSTGAKISTFDPGARIVTISARECSRSDAEYCFHNRINGGEKRPKLREHFIFPN
jgi:hypothetical protein